MSSSRETLRVAAGGTTVVCTRVPAATASAPCPVLLLHGNPDSRAVWEPLLEQVAREAPELELIAPDLPGFGDTAPPAGFPFTLEAAGELTAALCDALELPRVHLVVHDVGGFYGLTCAARHPERVASLTVLNTLFFPDYGWHFWARVWRRRGLGELAMRLASWPLFWRELRRGAPGGFPRDMAREAYARLTPTTKRCVLQLYRQMDPPRFARWEAELLAAELPTRVVWGERDPFIPPRFAGRFGGSAVRLPEVGHWPMVEAPERAARELIDHVRSVVGSS